MKNFIFLVTIGLISYSTYGQHQLDSIKAAEDFTVFQKILTEGHPALYEYISKDSLSHLFSSQRNKISDSTTDIDLYKSLVTITSPIGDGHLQLFAPNTLKTESYYFPLILKIIDSEFYTDTKDFGIPIGSWFSERRLEVDPIKFRGMLSNVFVEKVNQEHISNKADWRSFLWAYHSLERWSEHPCFRHVTF